MDQQEELIIAGQYLLIQPRTSWSSSCWWTAADGRERALLLPEASICTASVHAPASWEASMQGRRCDGCSVSWWDLQTHFQAVLWCCCSFWGPTMLASCVKLVFLSRKKPHPSRTTSWFRIEELLHLMWMVSRSLSSPAPPDRPVHHDVSPNVAPRAE